MKKILPFLFVIVGLLMWGCDKEEPLDPFYPNDYGDLQYTIKGVRDTFVEQTGKVYMQLFVERSAGQFEDVSLTVNGMPPGMKANFSLQSAIPSYNTLLTFETEKVDAGKYSLQVVGASQTTGQKYFDMAITVLPYSNPALALEGRFNEQRACTQVGDSTFFVDITPVKDAPSKVDIKGIWIGEGRYTVRATVNATEKTIVIPAQNKYNLVFQGSGTYSKDGIQMSYTVADTLTSHIVNDNCISTFTKQ